MSKKLKRILAAAVAVVILAGVAGAAAYVTANQTPSVIYNGTREEFTLKDALPNFFGDTDGPQDLFTGFKDMMPGDAVNQKIKLKVESMDSDRVYIYMSARIPDDSEIGAENSYQDLLDDTDNWQLSVDWSWDQVESVIAAKGNVEDIRKATQKDVLVGVFKANGSKDIDVNLALDIWAESNEWADKIAVVDWYFYAVEENDPTPPGPNPPEPPGPDTPHVPSLETDKHINYIIGYDDGLVHPEGNLTRAQTAAIFYRLLTDAALVEMWSTEPCFSDVPETSWYFMYVATLTNGGILTGYPDGTFLPNQAITRAEFATIVARFDDRLGQIETTATFPDIQGRWFQEYIEFAATCGYVHGYPDGTFRPDEYITRAEAATLINHCLERHVDAAGLEGFENITNWPDNADPERWFYYEIVEAANYHDSKRSNRTDEGLVFQTEIWTKLYEPIDWEKIEQEWIKHLTGNEDFITKS